MFNTSTRIAKLTLLASLLLSLSSTAHAQTPDWIKIKTKSGVIVEVAKINEKLIVKAPSGELFNARLEDETLVVYKHNPGDRKARSLSNSLASINNPRLLADISTESSEVYRIPLSIAPQPSKFLKQVFTDKVLDSNSDQAQTQKFLAPWLAKHPKEELKLPKPQTSTKNPEDSELPLPLILLTMFTLGGLGLANSRRTNNKRRLEKLKARRHLLANQVGYLETPDYQQPATIRDHLAEALNSIVQDTPLFPLSPLKALEPFVSDKNKDLLHLNPIGYYDVGAPTRGKTWREAIVTVQLKDKSSTADRLAWWWQATQLSLANVITDNFLEQVDSDIDKMKWNRKELNQEAKKRGLTPDQLRDDMHTRRTVQGVKAAALKSFDLATAKLIKSPKKLQDAVVYAAAKALTKNAIEAELNEAIKDSAPVLFHEKSPAAYQELISNTSTKNGAKKASKAVAKQLLNSALPNSKHIATYAPKYFKKLESDYSKQQTRNAARRLISEVVNSRTTATRKSD